jgi:hypothetical protein
LFALTSSHASFTSHFEISNDLACDFNWSTEFLPDPARLTRSTQPRTTRPLRSTPITGASALLRAGPPAHLTSVLDPLQFRLLGTLPLARHQDEQRQGTPSPVPCGSRRPGSRRLHAGHRLASKLAPARLIPGLGIHPGFDVALVLTTRQQRFTCVRLPGPHLTPLTTPFPRRSPRRSSANAARGGLETPPVGRLRRANNLHLPHSITSRTVPTTSSIHVQDTNTQHPWATQPYEWLDQPGQEGRASQLIHTHCHRRRGGRGPAILGAS